jgi:eukaryotic-like serine/threonine-protein kinase
MGEVFLAEDTTLGRKVAIKMLPETRAGNDRARRRLINEARAAAALDHPNICAIHEVGEEDDRVFIVMQYIDGENLAGRIRQHPLPPAEVVDIGIQAAQALEEAHAAGVIHRDIKPQNMIVTPRGQLKVLDFGLATVAEHDLADAQTMERLTVEGSTVGTPGFMSPEQLLGRDVDARSDIFSLGIICFELLTGRPPFCRGVSHRNSVVHHQGHCARARSRALGDTAGALAIDPTVSRQGSGAPLAERAGHPERAGRSAS